MHFSATDTYNLSISDSSKKSEIQDKNDEDEDDEPTNPFVQNSPQ